MTTTQDNQQQHEDLQKKIAGLHAALLTEVKAASALTDDEERDSILAVLTRLMNESGFMGVSESGA